MRDERNGAGLGDQALGQRGADQDVAGRVRDGVRGVVQQHRDGEREEPDNDRPVLLQQQVMRQPDGGGVHQRGLVQRHQGHVRREVAGDAPGLQRRGAVHQSDGDGCGAASCAGAEDARPLLLECIWSRR